MRFTTICAAVLLMYICMTSCHRRITNATPQTAYDQELQATLRQIWQDDQRYRLMASEMRKANNGLRTREEGEMWKKQTELDSLNWIKVEPLLTRYGYPGKSLVGEELKSVCAFVIIHNPKIQAQYLPLLWEVAGKGEIDKREVAILEDRINMLQGKPQIYGTAMKYEFVRTDPETGDRITGLRLWPIADIAGIDKKREAVGLYSLKLQCELENIFWDTIPGYFPAPNKFDFDPKQAPK